MRLLTLYAKEIQQPIKPVNFFHPNTYRVLGNYAIMVGLLVMVLTR